MNHSLRTIGDFNYDEIEQRVYLYYQWIGSQEGIDIEIIKGIIGQYLLRIEMMAPIIQKIASGKVLMNEYLEEVMGIVE